MAAIGAWRSARRATGTARLATPGSTVVPGRQAGMLGQQTSTSLAWPPRSTRLPALHRRLPGRDQMMLAVTDQVRTAHLGQRLAQQRPVLRIVIAQEGLVQTALTLTLDGTHRLALVIHLAQRVLARMVHGRGRGHRGRIERLHLIGTEAVALEPERQVHHVLIGGARMGGDEIRDQVLLLARFLAELVEHLLETVVAADAGLDRKSGV